MAGRKGKENVQALKASVDTILYKLSLGVRYMRLCEHITRL